VKLFKRSKEVASVHFDDSGEVIVEGYCHLCKTHDEAKAKDYCRNEAVDLCDYDR